MKKFVCLLGLMFVFIFGKAQTNQTRYIIKFKNKGFTSYTISNPSAYLSQRAIDRRTRYNIAIDSTDIPVTARYVDSIRLAGAVTILNVSKWLNQVSIQTSDAAALTKINSFSFVQSAQPIAPRTASPRDKFEQGNSLAGARLEGNYYSYGQSFPQIHIHNGEFLHNIGLRGQGMQIGVLDGGFTNYNSLTAFDSIRNRNGFLDVYNFVLKSTNVNTASHGLECLSTIGTNLPGSYVGTAPGANFYLYVSEDVSSEYPIEEHNWVCAAERVDSIGGDVISSSLGYSTFDNAAYDHTYSQMNGKTTMVSIGATIAARKGILVLNSAGNSGGDSWHYIVAPADADSIVAVGAVGIDSAIAAFSSFGPTADGRIKPDVSSVGANTRVVFTNGAIGTNNGTSFACPNMAGLATCLWQGFPELNNIKIVKALQQASHKYTNPDNHIGYGIPDMKKAVLILLKNFTTATASVSSCKTTFNWKSKDMNAMKYEIERQVPGTTTYVKIGEQAGTGSVFDVHSYSFADSLINVQAGNLSYRIKEIVDTTTGATVSDYIITQTVSLANSCITTGFNPVTTTGNELLLVPNPVAQNIVILKLTLQQSIQNLQIQIIDAAGKLVYTSATKAGSGTNTIPVDVTRLAKGKYIISLYSNETLIATQYLIRL